MAKSKRRRQSPTPDLATTVSPEAQPQTPDVAGTAPPAPAGWCRRALKSRWLPLTTVLLAVAVVNTLTMPALMYPGDNFCPRTAASRWITTGSPGIPYAERALLGQGVLEKRGQYYFENDAKQRFYSKYGIGYTLFYLPPLWIQSVLHGEQEMLHPRHGRSLLVTLNLYHILLALVTSAYLFLLAASYTPRRWIAALFTLLSIYTTFLWYYLRAPALEIYQIPCFAGFGYHFQTFLRAQDERPLRSRRWLHLVAATLYTCLLLLMKSFFVLLLPPIWLFAWCSGQPGIPLWRRPWANLLQRWKPFLLALVLPTALTFACLLISNTIKFGSPLETGYSQWLRADGLPNDHFRLSYFPKALRAVILRPSPSNLLQHYPVLLAALLGWPLFIRKQPREALLWAACSLPPICTLLCFSSFTGEWCYGPRYFVFSAMLLSLPLVYVIDFLARRKAVLLRMLAGTVLLTPLLLSLMLQTYVCSMHYFAWHYLKYDFARHKIPAVTQYFGMKHRAILCRDVALHLKGQRTFPPVAMMRPRVAPADQARFRAQTDALLRHCGQSNYLLLQPAENKR